MFDNAIRKELKATLRLSTPVVFTQLSLMMMGMVDMIMVGDLGEVSIGALGMGNAVYLTIVFSFTGILMALDAIVGKFFGARQHQECGRSLWQGYWLAIGLSLPLTFLFYEGDWIGPILGQTEAVSVELTGYLTGRTWATLPFMVWAAQRGLLSGIGRTPVIFYVAVFGNVANVFADWVLIYGKLGFPALGVTGAGYATSFCSYSMVLETILVVHKQKYRVSYGTGFHAPDLPLMKKVVRLGIPFGLHLGVEMGAFGMVAVIAGWISETALAAHQIAMTCAAFTFMVPLGLSVGASVRVAQCLGGGDIDGAARAGKVAIVLGLLFMSISAVVFFVFPEHIAGVFTEEAHLMGAAVALLQIAAIFQLSDALQVIGAGCLRGTGDTDLPFIANLFGHWAIGLPIGWYLAVPFKMGAPGLWIGLTLGLTLVGIALVARFLQGKWKETGGTL